MQNDWIQPEIIQNIPDGFYVIDRDWRLSSFDRMPTSLSGKKPDELVGRYIWDLFPQYKGTALETTYRNAMDNHMAQHVELEGPTPGQWGSVVVHPSADGISVSWHDISRQKKETTLRLEQEQMYRTILENSRDGINLLDLKAGKYIYVNQAQLEMTGYSAEELYNISLDDVCSRTHPEDFDIVLNYQTRVITGLETPSDIVYRWKTLDNEYRWFGDRRKLVRDAQGQPIALVGIIRDITERKRIEEALKESEGRFRILVDTVAQAVWETDAAGSVCTDSPSWRALTGQTYEAFIDRGWVKAIHPDDWQQSIEQWRNALATGSTYDVEYRVKNSHGDWVWTNAFAAPIRDPEGNITKWIGMNIDISQRKKAEEALHTSEEQMRLAMEAARLLLWVFDIASGQLCNTANFEKVAGFSQDLIPGQFTMSSIDQFLLKDDAAQFKAELTKTIRGEGDLYSEFRFVNPETDQVNWMVAHGTLINGKDKSQARVVGIVQNQTERKMAEENLRESEEHAHAIAEQLRQANENKNTFLSILSHELRNPLASILMGISLYKKLPSGIEQVEKTKEIMRLLERQTVQLSRLVDDLLDVTRIARQRIVLKKERIELNRLVQHVVSDFQSQFDDKEIKLQSEFLSGSIYLEADPVRLTQVIGNVLHNAAKFTDKGGFTLVIVEKDEAKAEAVISVRDSGIGIPSDILPKLFEPFMQADKSLDRASGGLGLGLVIAKGIVDLHGGSIEATSEGLERGTILTIRLPLTVRKIEQLDRVPISPWKPSHSLRILLIEDNPDLTEIMCELLENLRHEVIAASTGQDGIAKAKLYNPDVIICDIGLPGMSGYEVARHLRDDVDLKDIFLVAFSGYAQPEDLERSSAAGFDRHLVKPVDVKTLIEILSEVM